MGKSLQQREEDVQQVEEPEPQLREKKPQKATVGTLLALFVDYTGAETRTKTHPHSCLPHRIRCPLHHPP